ESAAAGLWLKSSQPGPRNSSSGVIRTAAAAATSCRRSRRSKAPMRLAAAAVVPSLPMAIGLGIISTPRPSERANGLEPRGGVGPIPRPIGEPSARPPRVREPTVAVAAPEPPPPRPPQRKDFPCIRHQPPATWHESSSDPELSKPLLPSLRRWRRRHRSVGMTPC
ncbi:hypothetical protein Vafri_2877, partial [Volvox africanus]